MVVGLGTGVTAGELTLYPDVKNIDIVEISPSVVEALPYFEKFTNEVHEDPRVSIHIGDAFRNKTFPAVNNKDGVKFGKKESREEAYIAQLYLYTDENGAVSTIKDEMYKYGPYLKGPETDKRNPYNDLYTLKCDDKEEDITARNSDSKTGWKFYTKTGVLMANDGAHDDF